MSCTYTYNICIYTLYIHIQYIYIYTHYIYIYTIYIYIYTLYIYMFLYVHTLYVLYIYMYVHTVYIYMYMHYLQYIYIMYMYIYIYIRYIYIYMYMHYIFAWSRDLTASWWPRKMYWGCNADVVKQAQTATRTTTMVRLASVKQQHSKPSKICIRRPWRQEPTQMLGPWTDQQQSWMFAILSVVSMHVCK